MSNVTENLSFPERQSCEITAFRKARAMTLIELLVVIVVLGMLLGLLIPALARAREESRKKNCMENLSQVGKAINNYYTFQFGYYPFMWGPATSSGSPNTAKWPFSPGVSATTACCDAATSIGCLYSQYLPSARIFRCPSTQDAPSFMMVAPFLPGTTMPATSANAYLFSQRTWSLVSRDPDNGWGASYGYDCRVYPSVWANHVIMGDMTGSREGNRLSSRPNHRDGQNVLWVDGTVKWVTTNYASNDPLDNIYCEGGESAPGGATDYWCADTDSYLVRGSVVLGLSWNEYTQIQQ